MVVKFYSDFLNSTSDGIYSFLELEHCFACNEYLKELKHIDTKTWTMVVLGDEEKKDFIKTGASVPLTRLYVGGEIQYEHSGILYSKQVRDLYSAVETFVDGGKILVPDIVLAKPKNTNISCFQSKNGFSFTMFGKNIVLHQNEWLVIHDDNKLEILSEEDFDRRYELI